MQHKNNKHHTQLYRKQFAFNRNAAGFNKSTKEETYTLVCDKSNGAYVYDIDENEYIDLTMGFGSILFGHNFSPVREAITKQLEKSWSVGPITPLAGKLSKKLCEATGVERVAYFNSGTEAVMVAMRIAKAVTEKQFIVFFKGSYHGTFDTLLTLRSDSKSKIAQEVVPGVTQSILNESYLLEIDKSSSLDFIRENHAKIAAILIEPVQSRNPGLQPKVFLQELRSIATENNIALIFDEVITGFRIGIGGAQEYFGIKADIVTYGKVIGGGLPIGIVAGKTRFLDALDGGFWQFGDESFPKVKQTFVAGTFCHHPLAMATALKMLEIFTESKGKIFSDLNQKTSDFCERMNTFFIENGYLFSLSHFASLFRFNTPGRQKRIYQQLLLNGVYVWEGRNCFLSPAHNDEIIADLEEKIKMSCHQLEEQGVIKRKLNQ